MRNQEFNVVENELSDKSKTHDVVGFDGFKRVTFNVPTKTDADEVSALLNGFRVNGFTIDVMPASPLKNTKPWLYSMLEFTLSADGKTLTHELHLIAALNQKEAIKTAHHEGITTHNYCFITRDEAAMMGGATIKNVTAMKSDVIGVDEFERWARVMSCSEADDMIGNSAVYTRL